MPRARRSRRRSIPDPRTRRPTPRTRSGTTVPVSLDLTADDGVVGSGVASIAYHAGNAADTVVTDASNPALVRSPLGTASTSVGVSTRRHLHVQGNGRCREHERDRFDRRSTSTPPRRPRTAPCPTRACGTGERHGHVSSDRRWCRAVERGRRDCHAGRPCRRTRRRRPRRPGRTRCATA